MEDLAGRVAVVTGGAGGIGRAMVERFLHEGMQVVIADVEEPVLAAAVEELDTAHAGHVLGVRTDVADYASVEALRDAALERFGAVHVLCNNAGVGSGSDGRMWEHDLADWSWAFAVNVTGVVHGINAFVPAMIEQGTPGHVINTSSHNGGLYPLASTAIYSATKSAVVTITEVLWAQLREVGSAVSASVLFPSGRTPGLLNTGIWNSGRNRPDRYAKQRPSSRPPGSALDGYIKTMEEAGRPVVFADLDEIADQVIDAIRDDQFWIHPPGEQTDAAIRERSESMIARGRPDYMLARITPPSDAPKS